MRIFLNLIITYLYGGKNDTNGEITIKCKVSVKIGGFYLEKILGHPAGVLITVG